ncbi:hypothetical protein ACJJTC_001804, partial [Scirpophaga incertulas]
NQWDCSDGGLDWLAMKDINSTARSRIADYYNLTCHQQLYRGKPLHKVMDIIRTMHLTCPKPCECVMTHVVSDAAGQIIPLITVNCESRGLDAPPSSLPPNTTTLRLEGNKISTIRSIVQNPQYKKLADLYLDNNTISAVEELEASEWFSTFRVLSLRGNLLKQIPVYAFDKAFQVNNNIMHVFLGNNPWRCDCFFIPRFQGLLLKYKRVIRDLPDIRCSTSDDKASFVQGSNRNTVYQEVMIERKPFIWRTLQEHKDSNDSIICRNSVQGKLLLVDDKGYICNRNDVMKNGCCNPLSDLSHRYTCTSCNKHNCCIVYEHCVSCCLEPNKRDLLELVLSKLSTDENILFRTLTDEYELCLTKCRTSSHSVLHENSYKDPEHKHCFGHEPPGGKTPH